LKTKARASSDAGAQKERSAVLSKELVEMVRRLALLVIVALTFCGTALAAPQRAGSGVSTQGFEVNK
jgi:hypothetical protein